MLTEKGRALLTELDASWGELVETIRSLCGN
jgi:DNA-binding PadR family transcriptional regulator